MPFGDGDGAKTTIWTGGSRTILNFVHAAKRRRRMLLIGSAVALAVAGVVTFGVLRYLSAQAATRVVESYGALSQCLLGEPLKEGERASVRFRDLQLAALAGAEVARAKNEPVWPERCAPHAYALNDALAATDLGEGAGKPLVTSSKALGEALEKKGSYFADLSQPVDAAFEDARAANVALGAAPNIPAPPAPLETLDADSIPETARIAKTQLELSALEVEPHRSGTVRFLATADARAPQPITCTFGRDRAKCSALPEPIAKAAGDGLALSGTADEESATLVFADGGKKGIFRSDNGLVFESAQALGGYTTLDGFSAVLRLDGDRLELLRTDGDDTKSSGASPGFGKDVLSPERDAQLLWGQVLWAIHDEGQFSLAAAPVDPKKGLGDVDELGALDKEPAKESAAMKRARIDGCHAGQTTVARIRVARHSYLSFLLNNRWTKPIKAAPAGGSLSCHHKEAVITQVGSQGGSAVTSTITQHVCSPTACDTHTTVVSDVLASEAGLAPIGDIHVVGLAGKALFVWQAGQRGGVRMRFGAVSSLASASDVVLFDGYVKGGQVVGQSTVQTMRVLPAEELAVVLLNTSAGVFALRVTADGKAAPVEIAK